MLKKLGFGLLPLGTIMITLAKLSDFSGNETIFWIGFILTIPFLIFIGWKIIKKVLEL